MPNEAASQSALSLDELQQIDSICQEFESRWLTQPGTIPDIEQFFVRTGTIEFQRELLSELLRLDITYRQAARLPVQLDDYINRIPDQAATVKAVLFQWNQQEAALTETILPKSVSSTPNFTADEPPTPGSRFGQYELFEKIAQGGMGAVYRGRQPGLNRDVALKVMLAGRFASEEEQQRFYKEAQAAGKLQHPNIVPIYEIGEHNGQLFLSMAFIKGPSLKQVLADGPLPARQAATILLATTKAVSAAHDLGIIHRDLKPANIIVDVDQQPKVTDFGLAKMLSADSEITSTGQILGTPSYMPPEQARGEQTAIGPASDVYSLGATLYCALTGRPPFQAATVVETLKQVCQQDPVSPRTLNPQIPLDLETICLRALQKRPADRYPSAAKFADELERYLTNRPIKARPVSTIERFVRWAQRNPVLTSLSATAVLMLCLLTTISTVAYWREVDLVEEKDDLIIKEQRQSRLARESADEAKRLSLIAADNARRAELGQVEKERQRKLAEDLAEKAIDQAYLSSIRLAAAKWELGDIAGMNNALETARLISTTTDRRSWEWNYLWNLSHGSIRDWQAHSEPVKSLCYSADGTSLYSIGRYGSLRVWESLTGTMQFEGPDFGKPFCHTICPQGQWCAGGLDDGTIVGIRLSDGAELFLLEGHKTPQRTARVQCLASTVDGRFLASGSSDDMSIQIWDVEQGARLFWIPMPGDPLSLAFSPDGLNLAVTDMLNPQISVWDAHTGLHQANLEHETSTISVCYSPDGKSLAAASKHGRIRIWNTADYSIKATFSTRNAIGMNFQITFSPDGEQLFASNGTSGVSAITVWNSQTGELLQEIPGSETAISEVAMSPDGRWIATGNEAGEIHLWAAHADATPVSFDTDPQSGREPGQTRPTRFVSLISPCFNDNRLYTSGMSWDWGPRRSKSVFHGRNFQVWDRRFGACTESFRSESCIPCGISLDGRQLIGLRKSDKALLVWDWDPDSTIWSPALIGTESPSMLPMQEALDRYADGKERSLELRYFNFSPDGMRFIGISQSPLPIWNLANGSSDIQLPVNAHPQVATFSRDGRWIATGDREYEVKLWSAKDGTLARTLEGHEGYIMAVAMSPDGDSLVSSSGMNRLGSGADLSVRCWDLTTGEERWKLMTSANEVNSLEFSRDGRRVFCGSSDGTITVRDARNGIELLTVRAFADRPDLNMDFRSRMALSEDGSWLYVSAGSPDGSVVRIFDGRAESSADVRAQELAARNTVNFLQAQKSSLEEQVETIMTDIQIDDPTRQLALDIVRLRPRTITLLSSPEEQPQSINTAK